MVFKIFQIINSNLIRSTIFNFKPKYIHLTSSFFKNEESIGGTDDFDIDEINENDSEYEQLSRRYFGISQYHSCFIIHPYVKWGVNKVRDATPQQRIEEAVALIRTLDPWKVVGHQIVPLENLQKKSMFGKGTMEKLKSIIRGDPSITAVFINKGTLKNMQVEELEKTFRVPVFDRYKIVMQILRLHATSKHAKLQIALAEIPYLRNQLRSSDASTAVSSDKDVRKLILQNREQKILRAIDKLRAQRQLLRKRRKQIDYPVVAIVGYTNSGKTSLIKSLTGEATLQPRNQLFATLDVTMHEGKLPSSLQVLYVDTVGFISDIPTNLIECFIATLEDALLADIIVHVEDLSNDALLHQRNNVLATLNILAKQTSAMEMMEKIITVGNKVDIANAEAIEANDCIKISCIDGTGIEDLKYKIEEAILTTTDRVSVKIKVPIGGDEIRWLYKNSAVIDVEEDPQNSQNQTVRIIITKAKLHQFKHHFITSK